MARLHIYANRNDYNPPPCPNCGAPAVVTWIDVSKTQFIPAQLECSARCFEDDMDSYLTAIHASDDR